MAKTCQRGLEDVLQFSFRHFQSIFSLKCQPPFWMQSNMKLIYHEPIEIIQEETTHFSGFILSFECTQVKKIGPQCAGNEIMKGSQLRWKRVVIRLSFIFFALSNFNPVEHPKAPMTPSYKGPNMTPSKFHYSRTRSSFWQKDED